MSCAKLSAESRHVRRHNRIMGVMLHVSRRHNRFMGVMLHVSRRYNRFMGVIVTCITSS
jgi:hypothetical protein